MIHEHDALAWVEQGLTKLDMPTVDGLNTYLVSRAVASQGIKVALSGLGADELFGGYPSHRWMPWLQLLRWLPAGLRQPLLQSVRPRFAAKLTGLPRWDRWHLGLAVCAAGPAIRIYAQLEQNPWPGQNQLPSESPRAGAKLAGRSFRVRRADVAARFRCAEHGLRPGTARALS